MVAEPHSTVLVGALTGAGVSSFTILLGAQVDALAVGLIAAILASIWLETIDNKAKAASAVLLSSLLAGYGSPVAAQWVISSVDGVSGSDSLRLLLAAVIGLSCPRLVPMVMRLMGSKVGG